MTLSKNAYTKFSAGPNIYDSEDDRTHLWNKFDLIFVDEVHSLTADASFADSPFYVGQFIHHVQKFNPSCDIVLMSGTPDPTDWFFDDAFLPKEHIDIDLYEKCIHLVPDKVFLMGKARVPEQMLQLYQRGKRQIYFVNSVGRMASLVETLVNMGIPLEVIGIAYTESDNESKLPVELVNAKESLRNYLIENSKLPETIKIFITTTQNKEGISIEDDDIKYMFSESHQKAELEQMAGRVRGNPGTGTGLYALILVHDAQQHSSQNSYVEKELDRCLLPHISGVLDSHKQLREAKNKKYVLADDIATIHKTHRYIRYDYIGKEFCFYEAREKCAMQAENDHAWLATYLALYDQTLEYCSDGSGNCCAITGKSELNQNWFPYSALYISDHRSLLSKEELFGEAAKSLRTSLENAHLIGVRLDEAKQQEVYAIVFALIDQYGEKLLGFSNPRPVRLKKPFGPFGLTWDAADHHSNDKIIRVQPPVELEDDVDI